MITFDILESSKEPKKEIMLSLYLLAFLHTSRRLTYCEFQSSKWDFRVRTTISSVFTSDVQAHKKSGLGGMVRASAIKTKVSGLSNPCRRLEIAKNLANKVDGIKS